jgi:hypothetical protein
MTAVWRIAAHQGAHASGSSGSLSAIGKFEFDDPKLSSI